MVASLAPLDRNKWYWTPQKLNALVKTIKKLAKEDEAGYYIGPGKLASSIMKANPREFNNPGYMWVGISILIFLEILEMGKQGPKRPGYKRRFYPEALKRDINWRDVELFREAQHRRRKLSKYRER